MTVRLKFPHGISDFRKLMLEDYFYVDRRADIRLIWAKRSLSRAGFVRS